MNLYPVDLVIIFGYLIITLWIGIKVGTKNRNMRDYAIGGKNFSTFVLTATIFATFVGGKSILGKAEQIYSFGIAYLIAGLGYVVAHLIIGYVIGPRMDNFQDQISPGEILESHYGKWGRVVAGLLGFVYSASKIAVEIGAIGYVFQTFINIDYFYGVMLGFGIVVIYSAFGGVRSVTFTDVFQFLIIIGVLPVVAIEGLRHIHGVNGLFSQIHQIHPTHLQPWTDPVLVKKYLPLLFVFAIPSLSPANIQRLLMAKKGNQAKRSFVFASWMECGFDLIVGLMALTVLVLSPHMNANLTVTTLIQNYTPHVLKGLAVAGLIAAVMSTADSHLNSGSVTLVHDTIKPFFGDKLSDKMELFITRIGTFILGISGAIIATKFSNLVELILSMKKFWMPVIVPILLGTLLGFKTTKARFWWAIIAGLIAVLSWERWITPKYHYEPLLPSTLVNMLVFFGPGLLLKGLMFPFVFSCKKILLITTSSLSSLFREEQIKNWGQTIVYRMDHLRPIMPKLYDYFNQLEKSQGSIGPWFGVFMFLYTIIPSLFFWHEPAHYGVWSYLRMIGAMACVGVFMKERWKPSSLKYWGIIYYSVAILVLPFTAIFLVYDSGGQFYSLGNAFISFMLLIFLVDWANYLLLGAIGSALGWGVSQLAEYYDPAIISTQTPEQWTIFHLYLGVCIAASLFFSRGKQIKQKNLLESAESMAGLIAHELRGPISTTMAHVELFEFALTQCEKDNGYLSPQTIKALRKQLEYHKHRGEYSNQLVDNILHNVRGERDKLNVFPVLLSVSDCVHEAVATFAYEHEEHRALVKVNLDEDIHFYGTKVLVIHALYNLLKNAFKAIRLAQKGDITISTMRQFGRPCLIITDTALGIPQDKQMSVLERFESYWAGGIGLGLAFCRDVMKSMGGSIDIDSQEGKYTSIILRFVPASEKNVPKRAPIVRQWPKRLVIVESDFNAMTKLKEWVEENVDYVSLDIYMDPFHAVRELNKIYYKGHPGAQIAGIIADPGRHGMGFFEAIQDREIKRIWYGVHPPKEKDNAYVHVFIDKNNPTACDELLEEVDWPIEPTQITVARRYNTAWIRPEYNDKNPKGVLR
ncbi:MAG: hypothetical protein A2007_03255 [Verrucomicrobia bacterium GWC2_42_7]|nr:MAG: hypothetical protein A2007_03255 [Verrucomicrobia bacterium GWC2_42_7]